jgi:hypothetical protein
VHGDLQCDFLDIEHMVLLQTFDDPEAGAVGRGMVPHGHRFVARGRNTAP